MKIQKKISNHPSNTLSIQGERAMVKKFWSFGLFPHANQGWWWWPPKKTLLLGVMQIRPETSKFLCLCCMIFPSLAQRSKAHARKLLIYFFTPFLLQIFENISQRRNDSIFILQNPWEVSYINEKRHGKSFSHYWMPTTLILVQKHI